MTKTSLKNELLSYVVIAKAIAGDVDAVNKVLKHYEGYIAVLAMKRLYDRYGNQYTVVDDDLRRRLETKLITAIVQGKFKIR